jgi:hypothetical protein
MPDVLCCWPNLEGELVKELLKCEQAANWSQSPARPAMVKLRDGVKLRDTCLVESALFRKYVKIRRD